MSKYYLLGECEVFCRLLLQGLLLAVKLSFEEVKYIYILLVLWNLSSINLQEQLSHAVVIHEGLLAVAGQIKVFICFIFFDSWIYVIVNLLRHRLLLLIKFVPVNLEVVHVSVEHGRCIAPIERVVGWYLWFDCSEHGGHY